MQRTVSAAEWRPLIRALVCILALGFLAALLAHELFPLAQWTQSDLFTYMGAARDMRHGRDPYAPVAAWIHQYSGGPLRADYYVYPPFLALLLLPLTFIPFNAVVILWGLSNLLFLLGTVLCTLKAVGRPSPPWFVLPLTAAVALLSPVRMELQWGQADIMLACLIAVSFLAARTRHPILGGLALALAAVIKPPLLALALFYLWKRERRLALSASVAAALLFFLPFLPLGRAALDDQLAVWRFWSSRFTPFIDNISPKGVFTRLFTHNPNGPGLIDRPALAVLLWLLVAAVALLILLTATRRDSVAASPAAGAEFSLAVCTVLLISPLTEWIYLTLLAIPLLVCGSSVLSLPNNGWRRGTGAAALLSYAALCAPLNRVEYAAWPSIAAGGVHGAVAVAVAAVYLYPLLAVYGLSLVLFTRQTGWRPTRRVRPGVGHGASGGSWPLPATVHAPRSPSRDGADTTVGAGQR